MIARKQISKKWVVLLVMAVALPQNIPESEIMKQAFAMIDQCDAVVFSTKRFN